jgi:hypothetical protein
LNLSRTTIYRHLDIFEFFGKHLIKEGEKGGTVYAKLALAVPLLRKEKDEKNRAKLLNKFWHDSKTKSIRQLRSEVGTITRINTDNDNEANDISITRNSIELIKHILPIKPNKQEVALYLELANYIEYYCLNV